ncbi:patched domain-containing protein 3 [Anabrus simplex]|uniref:patched domain-containing protein 3 n=1 Tax=Anabrus simplex TaxID=316456 RepID=UPI0035A3A4BF
MEHMIITTLPQGVNPPSTSVDASRLSDSGEPVSCAEGESELPNTSTSSIRRSQKIRPRRTFKLGTINIQTMIRVGKLKQVLDAMREHGIGILALQETRFRDEDTVESEGYVILKGKPGIKMKQQPFMFGTAFIVDRSFLSSVIDWKGIAELEMQVHRINISGRVWEDVCARYQSWFENSDSTSFDTSDFEEILGGLDESTFQNDCIYQSVLKFWVKGDKFDSVFKLKQKEILDTITKKFNDSKPKNILEDVSTLLSGVQWGPNGTVTGARATILNWMVKKSDNSSSEWELEFLKNILHTERELPKGMKIFAVCTRSYKDVLGQVLENNKTILFAGFSLIILYVIIMLGRCNLIQQRIVLSLLGVLVVGKSIAASYGICFYMGFFWGPLHPILPFLLLGVGVDNTYVIVQCLHNLQGKEKMDIPERIGRALQQAGVSITVTSLTDILAFAVGTSTVMPFLRSFCVFASVGILCLYVFEIFFFVSCLAVDERRILDNRDCFFIRHNDWTPNECSQRNIQQVIFTKYVAPTMMKTPVKVIILLTAVIIFSINVWCTLQVERKFDPIWYLNQDSYPIKFNQKLNEYFPQYGKRAGIYMAGINFYEEKDALDELASHLESNPFINKGTLDVWYKAFDKWLIMRRFEPESDDEYKQYLIEFLLLTTEGQAYIKDLRFKNFLSTEYNITAAQIPIQYIVINTTAEQVLAMDSVNQIIKSYNYSNEDQKIVAFSPDYVAWTANKIIGQELLRNLGLTLVAVIVVTIILIQNLQTAFWVNCCVVFTVVDLIGSMYWLNLTIEISTSLMVLLCAGLAVDYAAHIGHEFTRLQGSKNGKLS